jgi:tetratricopeptide (TPR) repeat protein
MIEDAKLIVAKSDSLDTEHWSLVILNVEADAVIHDHSGFFEKQRKEILKQINNVIEKSKNESNFELLYASLSQIRLDEDISLEKEFDKIKSLLNRVRNIDLNEQEQTETPLSAFCNDPTIDYKLLESEILEEFIRMMFMNKLNPKDIIVSLKECEKIKLSKQINDKEGLAFVYHSLAKCYLNLDDKKKADYYFNETLNLGKKIGSDYYESQGRIGRGNIILKKGDLDGALGEFRAVSKLRIWDDKEIQYLLYIGMINIVNLNNDTDLKKEYLLNARQLIQEDENKGYLCEELRALISNGR